MADSGPVRVVTSDWHTAGEPFRIVTDASLVPEGATALDRRDDAAARLDHVRRLLVNEPRGHADMYGCFVTPPDDDGAHLGVVFFHNAGYSTACGHGTIALVTWALESGSLRSQGLDASTDGDVEVVVDVPSGRLRTLATVRRGRVRQVAFVNVPSYVLRPETVFSFAGVEVPVTVAYGGAFYASVPVAAVGSSCRAADLPALIGWGRRIKDEIEAAADVTHPADRRLRGVYGAIFWADLEPGPGEALRQVNITVFADGEVDRSPCGSGTSARLAVLHHEGRLAPGDRFAHLGISGQPFSARIVSTTGVAGALAVVTEVAGQAFPTGDHTFVLDPADPLGTGFLLR